MSARSNEELFKEFFSWFGGDRQEPAPVDALLFMKNIINEYLPMKKTGRKHDWRVLYMCEKAKELGLSDKKHEYPGGMFYDVARHLKKTPEAVRKAYYRSVKYGKTDAGKAEFKAYLTGRERE